MSADEVEIRVEAMPDNSRRKRERDFQHVLTSAATVTSLTFEKQLHGRGLLFSLFSALSAFFLPTIRARFRSAGPCSMLPEKQLRVSQRDKGARGGSGRVGPIKMKGNHLDASGNFLLRWIRYVYGSYKRRTRNRNFFFVYFQIIFITHLYGIQKNL